MCEKSEVAGLENMAVQYGLVLKEKGFGSLKTHIWIRKKQQSDGLRTTAKGKNISSVIVRTFFVYSDAELISMKIRKYCYGFNP